MIAAVALLAAVPPGPGRAQPAAGADAALAGLGFGDAAVSEAADRTRPVGDAVAFYRFAADPAGPPTIDPGDAPYAVPQEVGAGVFQWDEGSVPGAPDADGGLFLTSGPGIVPGRDYLVGWLETGGEIPLADPAELWSNWSLVLGAEGLEAWQPLAEYPGDTWGGGCCIMYAERGPGPWAFHLARVEGGRIVTQDDLGGFAFFRGDSVVFGADAALVGDATALGFRWAGHFHEGDYGISIGSPSIIFTSPPPGDPLWPFPPEGPVVVGETTTTTEATTTTESTTTTEATTTSESTATTEATTTSGSAATSSSLPVMTPTTLVTRTTAGGGGGRSGGDGEFPWWLFLIGGGLLVPFVIILIVRTRRRVDYGRDLLGGDDDPEPPRRPRDQDTGTTDRDYATTTTGDRYRTDTYETGTRREYETTGTREREETDTRERQETGTGDDYETTSTRDRYRTETYETGTRRDDTTAGTTDAGPAGGGGEQVFGDREPPKPDCRPLREECERLRERESEARLRATRRREEADRLAAECQRARNRIADLERRIAELEADEGAPNRYTRIAWLQQDLRQASSDARQSCDRVEEAQAEAAEAETEAAEAKAAADAACAAADACEAGG